MPLVTDARRNILGLLRHFVGKQRIKTMDASIVMLQNGNRMMSLFSSCARMGRSCLSPGLCPITDRSARRFAPTARRGRQDDGFVGGLEYSLWICRRREKNPNFFDALYSFPLGSPDKVADKVSGVQLICHGEVALAPQLGLGSEDDRFIVGQS
jgi:hypothetical protein